MEPLDWEEIEPEPDTPHPMGSKLGPPEGCLGKPLMEPGFGGLEKVVWEKSIRYKGAMRQGRGKCPELEGSRGAAGP